MRIHQAVYVTCILALCWLGMMATHELGHIAAAILTGGQVNRVVLHPAAISRTDVSPNPSPSIVVWAGPIVGCLVPLLVSVWHGPARRWRKLLQFFAGFCLVANGSYIGVGWFDKVGDAGEMLRCGTPVWAMAVFGIVTVAWGFFLWHRLGSLRTFLKTPASIDPWHVWGLASTLALVVLVEFVFSSNG